ncbi:MAG: histidine phosphatase family protein [Bacteroidales bacterium]|nr:histidine phosphatase family protein [Bacteroidales bacterium]
MKTLFLTRHGKTNRREPGMKDFDRALTDRGKSDVLLVVRELKKLQLIPELLLSSPARRAVETTGQILQEWPSLQVKTLDFLYGYFTWETFISQLQLNCGGTNRLMVVGHNPAMSEIGASLTGDYGGHLPTSGTYVIDFEVGDWNEIMKRSGHLREFIYPAMFR